MSPIQQALLILQDRINDDIRDVIPDVIKLLEPEKKKFEDTWDECDKFKGWVTGPELEEKKSAYLKSIYEK